MATSKADLITLYNPIAQRYESRIVPVMRHFAQGVVDTAAPKGAEHTLDIGTGTGVLARQIAPRVRKVVGIDIVPEMIKQAKLIARRRKVQNVVYWEADTQETPFDPASFDLVVASFGLNATTPSRVFPEIARVLRKNGGLVFHEWNVQHPLDTLFGDVLADYMVGSEEATRPLLRLRELVTRVRPWDNVFQDTADFLEELPKYGFHSIQVWEDARVNCVLPVNDFINYKLAWGPAQAELEAMDRWRRSDCVDALRRALYEYTNVEGNLVYNPLLFRVKAVRG